MSSSCSCTTACACGNGNAACYKAKWNPRENVVLVQWYDSTCLWWRQCMNEWSVECECVCMRLDEQMVSELNDYVTVAQVLCNMDWKLKHSQLAMRSIYYCKSVYQREKTHERVRERSLTLKGFTWWSKLWKDHKDVDYTQSKISARHLFSTNLFFYMKSVVYHG